MPAFYRKPLLSLCLAACLGVAAPHSAARAHDDWIEPNRFSVKTTAKKHPPFTISFDITGSDQYFTADLNRLNYDMGGFDFGILSPEGTRIEPSLMVQGQTKTFGEVALTNPGTHTLFFSRGETPLYYSSLKDGSYRKASLNKLNAADKAQVKETKGYFHFSKTYVVVEPSTTDWQKPLGQTLEIIPVSDPTALKSPASFTFGVNYRGAPLAHAKLHAVYDGYVPPAYGDSPVTLETNDKGVAIVKLDRPGRWLLAATHYEDAPDKSKASRLKYVGSLMLYVHGPVEETDEE